MITKITCNVCGMIFEVVNLPRINHVLCPSCSSEVDIKVSNAPVSLGEYSIVGLIGQGGMGQVFRAANSSGDMFAVKIMSQDLQESAESKERFDRETKIMASLKHENIVHLLECGQTSMFSYFVMELIEGENLRNLLRAGPLPFEKIEKISMGTLNALGFAHSKGIVHRDIKPENILISKTDQVKVTDFGLARKFSMTSLQENLTATNAFLGTENYMSPEQKINPRNVTHKSDIYSFGVVLYEMLSGGVLPMGLFQPPSHYRPASENWDSLSFCLLDINPDMRPLNCQSVLEEIGKIQISNPSNKTSSKATNTTPEIAGHNTDPSEDLLKKESERIQARLEEMLGVAYDHCQSGAFEIALPLWEQSLNLIDNPDERRNITEWINYCVNQINSKKLETGSKSSRMGSVSSSLNQPHFQSKSKQQQEENLMFLCPCCSKPFGKSAVEASKGEFSCPFCTQALTFDSEKKQISAAKGSKVTSSRAEKHSSKIKKVIESAPEISLQPTSAQTSSSFFETFLKVVSIVLVLDFIFSEVTDEFVAWVFKMGLTNLLGFNHVLALLYMRPLLNLGLFLLACYWVYLLYNHLLRSF